MAELKQIVLSCIITIGVILIIITAMLAITNSMQEQITSIQCCNNQTCSDTYYDANTNLCHLTLCEQNIFISNCTYLGKNITLEAYS